MGTNAFEQRPPGAGKSSFELVEVGKLFDELRLKRGSTFLDLACGKGLYSIEASGLIGQEGLIYAIDLWKEGITLLRDRIAAEGIRNIKPLVADVNRGVEIEDRVVDVCLMATVFHDLVQSDAVEGTMKELLRVLKPNGLLGVMEFKKIEGPPGPPLEIRLDAEEVERIITPYGFYKGKAVEVGPYNYLITFALGNASS